MTRCDEIGWLASGGIGRYRPGLIYIQLAMFTAGVFFWVDATLGMGGFKPGTWGEFAYSIPAKLWSVWNMGASAITMVGLMKPVNNRMVATGAALQCAQFSAISYSAAFTGGDSAIVVFSSVFFLPLHMWLLNEAARRGAIKF